ncbi:MAG: type I-C CRISPR-associated protein Cas5 [Chitinivibrionales bacterium]|nr:type I-C CRISPR-associated protein Cas5 [Chitinivibrionales bacterium]
MQAEFDYRLRVRGRFACFSRPEATVDRVSYEVPTPSAMRGMLSAIFWKPQIMWLIKEIAIVKPGSMISFGRNGLKNAVPSNLRPLSVGAGGSDFTQRGMLLLSDVEYVISATMVAGPGKHEPGTYAEMFERRIIRGTYFRKPCLGLREFVCDVEPAGDDIEIQPISKDLGVMLYDIIYRKEGQPFPLFFKPELKDGRINVDPADVLPEGVREEFIACLSQHSHAMPTST